MRQLWVLHRAITRMTSVSSLMSPADCWSNSSHVLRFLRSKSGIYNNYINNYQIMWVKQCHKGTIPQSSPSIYRCYKLTIRYHSQSVVNMAASWKTSRLPPSEVRPFRFSLMALEFGAPIIRSAEWEWGTPCLNGRIITFEKCHKMPKNWGYTGYTHRSFPIFYGPLNIFLDSPNQGAEKELEADADPSNTSRCFPAFKIHPQNSIPIGELLRDG